MDAEERQRRSMSFGAVARTYAETRPDYPPEAVSWLAGPNRARVLELGCGTGKLTRTLVGLGYDVVATDPSTSMLGELRQSAQGARSASARAEQIPLASSAVDVVISGQAFHWFDPAQALPEIARVLRPRGVLALVWNAGDFKVPWVRKVFSLIGISDDASADPLAGSDIFTTVEHKVFRHWQRFDRASLQGFIASSSAAAVLPPDERQALLDEVGALYDSYGRGSQGMLMPWQASCFRATVTEDWYNQQSPSPDDGLLIDFG